MPAPLRLLCLALLLTLPRLAGAAAPELTACIPADTKLVIRVDLAATLASKVGQSLTVAHADKVLGVKAFAAGVAGIDLDQVTSFWVFSNLPDTGAVVLVGKFSTEQMQGHLTMIPTMTLVERPGCSLAVSFKDDKTGAPKLAAIIDDKLLLLGDAAMVDHLLDAFQAKVPVLPANDAQLKHLLLDPHAFVLTVFGGPKNWPDFNKDDMGKYLSSVVKEFWLTGEFTADALATLTLTTDTVEHAAGAELILRGLPKLLVDSPDVVVKPLVVSALQSAQVVRQDTVVTVTATLPGKDILIATGAK